MIGLARKPLTVALLAMGAALAIPVAVATGPIAHEANTQVPMGQLHYLPGPAPDRIVVSPAADAATGFAVSWRTDASVDAPQLELAPVGDSPAFAAARTITATTRALDSETGTAHFHHAHVDGLLPDTTYLYRVQGNGRWSSWNRISTAGGQQAALTLLYFGDTQNKNLSHVSRVVRQAWRSAPDARLAIFAGDLVSGGDGQDDIEWGEWHQAASWLLQDVMTAPAAGNHEYAELHEDTPQEVSVLGAHWPLAFALPGNGDASVPHSSYWFDHQGVRVAVLDGTSALELGTAQAQARWLDGVLAGNARPWSIVVVHQPLYALRAGRDNAALIEHIGPVLEKHKVDLVLQGHDHAYGRRTLDGAGSPMLISSVAGPKQYRLSAQARATMAPVGEDTQFYQVLRLTPSGLGYQSFTASGALYDAFRIERDSAGNKTWVELTEGRMAPRDCDHRAATAKGRADRCWE
ncbi:MAG: fibronectin type III domain-containing protein [Stenotrophomonas sp.]